MHSYTLVDDCYERDTYGTLDNDFVEDEIGFVGKDQTVHAEEEQSAGTEFKAMASEKKALSLRSPKMMSLQASIPFVTARLLITTLSFRL